MVRRSRDGKGSSNLFFQKLHSNKRGAGHWPGSFSILRKKGKVVAAQGIPGSVGPLSHQSGTAFHFGAYVFPIVFGIIGGSIVPAVVWENDYAAKIPKNIVSSEVAQVRQIGRAHV